MRKKQLTWTTALLSLCAVVMLAGCGDTGTSQATAAQVLSVKAIKLGETAGSGLTGKIIPDQEVKIVSKSAGKVAAVEVNEGSVVKKGDVLVQLETDDLSQQVKQAESGLTAAQAKLADTEAGARSQEIQGLESAVKSAQAASEQVKAAVGTAQSAFNLAEKNYNRLRNMYDSDNTITKEDLDKGTFEFQKAQSACQQALAQQQAAEAQVSAAQSKLDLARSGATGNTLEALQAEVDRLGAGLELANSALNNATIVAPMDGVIVKRSIQPGEMAQPGVLLLHLVKIDQVQVELSVPDAVIGSMKTGTDVNVKVSNLPEKEFAGKVDFVSPVSNPNSSTFPVKVKVANPEGQLLAGMTAEVHLLDAPGSRLEIPKQALVNKENKSFIFTIEQDAAKAVEIAFEEKNEDWVHVAENTALKPGQLVIVNPTDALTDGSKVKVE
ncbi:efflux RND transporter periplasmic adaptor subunit [Paenibacillus xerothermodurans]|uniref:Efflux RND transporter periplasmic adaptor subunit n=1 Tax=Paenibacillus xerothermodurans TaxID=1977292 RepID=A0A2W1NKJ4_PAEXE|nr:efflux RND transporter periplasmic adaptor subunit [Paenibacillus xerothermodurans]PZE19915.1 efflux RND transporter periplasmic adaptor subunit [Paenibacillus xerothermodurans]